MTNCFIHSIPYIEMTWFRYKWNFSYPTKVRNFSGQKFQITNGHYSKYRLFEQTHKLNIQKSMGKYYKPKPSFSLGVFELWFKICRQLLTSFFYFSRFIFISTSKMPFFKCSVRWAEKFNRYSHILLKLVQFLSWSSMQYVSKPKAFQPLEILFAIMLLWSKHKSQILSQPKLLLGNTFQPR